jgi:glycine cleavage system regulatory protein
MQTGIVMTVMAGDRPGIVERLADIIALHEGNWVDSAMSRLGGEFAGILRISIDEKRVGELERALDELKAEGFTIALRRSDVAGAGKPPDESRKAYIEVVGQDHKGIVRDVSKVLADNNVNVDELRTEIFSGSMTGEHMFSAEADIVLPEGMELDELCGKLEELASDLMVDVRMCSIRGKQ